MDVFRCFQQEMAHVFNVLLALLDLVGNINNAAYFRRTNTNTVVSVFVRFIANNCLKNKQKYIFICMRSLHEEEAASSAPASLWRFRSMHGAIKSRNLALNSGIHTDHQ
jgi:hypothetical protein